ncbi:MFS transporter [Enemella evansiae]|uniref:MFS transporter n=1 Tax=Enemella evansiae TaxID=2016499 RepID=UPI000C01D1C9|nr:MFS transporter [Enemella evansiae]PFG68408.1 putative MFS family arabinose efflux permease [Propionibacteriaceae bacterium ES.041]
MSSTASPTSDRPIKSQIPARMHNMPWSRFHWMVILGLGTAWILDGLEVQFVSLAGYKQTLGMDPTWVGFAGTAYLLGQVSGALIFGRMADTLGRKKLFSLTLAVYLIGSGLAGLAPAAPPGQTSGPHLGIWIFLICRFIAGMGIGGEYSAINAAIDELIPGKYRGRVDLAINGTYWGGALIAAAASFFLLNPDYVPHDWGWRISFFIGPVLGIIIIFMRRHIPESPRWMVTHGRAEQAERIVAGIESEVTSSGRQLPKIDDSTAEWVKPREGLKPKQLAYVFFKLYPTRTVLGITLMITQSFLYNAFFFTYEGVLDQFYGKPANIAAVYFLPFAAGNLLGPLLLGHFFDTIGRRKMIGGTYAVAAIVLLISAFLFRAEMLSAGGHVALWCVSFFFASAGASAGYLTVSEIFPLEVRGQAISYFFSVAQAVGATGPAIFGALITASEEANSRTPMFWGYIAASVVTLIGSLVAFRFGVDAEGKALEEIAPPLSSYDEHGNETTRLPV